MATVTEHKSTNPVFRFAKYQDDAPTAAGVTTRGVALKALLYLGVLCLTGAVTWTQVYPAADGTPALAPGYLLALLIGGCLGGFCVGLFTIFVPRAADYTAPVYAALEGVVLGALSAFFEAQYPGIVLNAVLGTLGAWATVALLYLCGAIRVNQTFKAVLLAAMLGILFLYLVGLVVLLAGGSQWVLLHQAGNGWAIGLSVAIIVVAALCVAWDFQNVLDAQQAGAPKYFESYLAFGLLVTLIWLYLEVLRLLAILRGK